ncbi:MAG: stalk domain-containing protein [Anaerotignum sp.]|nr:stalk domain-containing protein [Anaerotignum sp.]
MIPLALIKSPVDERDWKYGEIVAAPRELPKKFSLKEYCGRVRSQGKAGFCHSFTGAAVKNIQERLETGRKFDFSPLALAKAVKEADGITYTEGRTLLTVCKALQENGIFEEGFYPYEKYEAGSLRFPKVEREKDLPKYFIKNYARVETLEDMKACIVQRKPLLLGVTCSEEIYEPTEGCIGLPIGSFFIGGHAMPIVAYDDDMEKTIRGRKYRGFFECMNSWGENYGEKGFVWLPYEYLTYRTVDFGTALFMDMYTTIDLENDNLKGTAVELYLDRNEAFDDGERVLLEQPPIADEKTGRTLVPLRFIGEALGAKVSWDKFTRGITVEKDGKSIFLRIGKANAVVDGEVRKLDQAPIVDEKTGRTLVPLRFVAKELGCTVLWDGKRRKITILK